MSDAGRSLHRHGPPTGRQHVRRPSHHAHHDDHCGTAGDRRPWRLGDTAGAQPGGEELVAEEARRPPPQKGSWPWRLAVIIASWALQAAVQEAMGFSAAL